VLAVRSFDGPYPPPRQAYRPAGLENEAGTPQNRRGGGVGEEAESPSGGLMGGAHQNLGRISSSPSASLAQLLISVHVLASAAASVLLLALA
jgi:hypothetical protein